MQVSKKIIAIIPARGGSKRVPRKNIKLLNGKPLISYAIKAAKKSKYVDRVIVSTDDLEIASVAKKYGAEVPFMRPAELATDTALALSVMQHAINYIEAVDKNKVDLVVLIQATSPMVLSEDIDAAIERLIEIKANSCVSVCSIAERPEWMYEFRGQKIRPFIKTKGEEIRRSQDLPKLFRLNGAVYVIRRDTLMKKGRILDKDNATAIVMPRERSFDIDEPIDFKIIESMWSKTNK